MSLPVTEDRRWDTDRRMMVSKLAAQHHDRELVALMARCLAEGRDPSVEEASALWDSCISQAMADTADLYQCGRQK